MSRISATNIMLSSSVVGDYNRGITGQPFDSKLPMDQYVRELPEDVIIDILGRLPAKSLAKFKLVSTSWYLIISDLCLPKVSPPCATAPLLGYIFFTRASETDKLSLKFCGDNSGREHCPLDSDMSFMKSCSLYLPYDQNLLQFHDYCNGLVLFARSSVVPTEYLVFNPTTRECSPLPVNPHHNCSELFSASLAFDPTDSLNYRVVLFTRSPLDATPMSPPVIDVYCSERGEWSSHDIPLDPSVYGYKCENRFVYLNGTLYCLSLANLMICINLIVVCSGNPTLDPKAYVLPLQDRGGLRRDCVVRQGFLGTSGGCLYYSNHMNRRLTFWVLDKGVEWVLHHSIDMSEVYRQQSVVDLQRKYGFPYHLLTLQVCALHPHNPYEMVVGTDAFMLQYNLRTKHLETILQTSNSDLVYEESRYVYPYSHCPLNFHSALRRND